MIAIISCNSEKLESKQNDLEANVRQLNDRVQELEDKVNELNKRKITQNNSYNQEPVQSEAPKNLKK
jgi:predicted nuclease with TOPRIM domain